MRSTVERAFAIVKRRFCVIDNEPFWDFKTQVDVVLASCILHNHITNLEPNDMIIQEVDVEPLVQPQNVQITQSSQGSQSYQTQREGVKKLDNGRRKEMPLLMPCLPIMIGRGIRCS